jgi:AraC-like DNA-binding protein
MNNSTTLTDEKSIDENDKKLISVYEKTIGGHVQAYDHNYRQLPGAAQEGSVEKCVCKHCPVRLASSPASQRCEPCRDLHVNAIKDSHRLGGISVYGCPKGLSFWCSPIFSDCGFSGALRGSGYLQHEPQKEKDAPKEFTSALKKLPLGSPEKIKSMAEILALCAASLSRGSKECHQTLRRRTDQQRDILAIAAKFREDGSLSPGYPLEDERRLIDVLHKGNMQEALDILNGLLAYLYASSPNQFKYIRLRGIELAVLLSRVDINSCQNKHLLETNYQFISLIKNAKTFEELADALHGMVRHIGGVIDSFRGVPHSAAMRKAERFIHENFTRKISLAEIAKVAGLSAPYFSTVFREEMGENLSKYLNRLRVEKASGLLLETGLSLSDIAIACCFEDQSWFSKIFKSFTGISPGKYRSRGGAMVLDISEENVSPECLGK